MEVTQRLAEITVSLVYLQQFKTFYCSERPLCGTMVFFTIHYTAVKSEKMQWDPLSSEMPQIQSHSLGAKQSPYLEL